MILGSSFFVSAGTDAGAKIDSFIFSDSGWIGIAFFSRSSRSFCCMIWEGAGGDVGLIMSEVFGGRAGEGRSMGGFCS